jgi:hypothetical protein
VAGLDRQDPVDELVPVSWVLRGDMLPFDFPASIESRPKF